MVLLGVSNIHLHYIIIIMAMHLHVAYLRTFYIVSIGFVSSIEHFVSLTLLIILLNF